ncbi:MAG: sigma-54-dependent transcriptional regulator [Salinivirgaceae bacterium]
MKDRPFTVFVVEDNEWYNKLLVHNISLNPDYRVEPYFKGKDCLKNLYKLPDVITLDYRLPDMTGLELLQKIKQENPEIQVVLISEQDDIDVVVDLLKLGAYDYIVKSNDIRERLLNTLRNINNDLGLKRELHSLKQEVQAKYDFQQSIIGESEPIKRVFDLINKAISTNIPVTLTGETGTGKELVAKAIHYNSARKNHPFVPLNVAAIPSELIESEMFGHEKGAFTGAAFSRKGKFEESDRGTLFLDEIGEMELPFQVKMLRALQEKEVYRIGSNKAIKTDSRIIVATHRNLQDEVKKGTFREDLFFRLFGLTINLPPLRERGNDILILARHFLKAFCKENRLPEKSISAAAKTKLMAYKYPGNIRELKAIIDLAATFSESLEITPDDIVFSSFDPVSEIVDEQLTLREFDKRIVKTYLNKYNNDTKLVAQKLDIGISTIYRMLKEDKNEG